MASLIAGSIAYDKIMTFEGKFSDHILPDQIHSLNLSFLAPTMRFEFGGCAANIAYSLNMLGGDARVMGTVGAFDAKNYLARFKALGLSNTYVKEIENQYTAQAMITTDLANNQITAFHPGAMMFSHENQIISPIDKNIKLGIVAPDGKQGMYDHAQQFHKLNIPFIFDPGQGLPLFNKQELENMINWSTYIAANDYETKLLSNKTDLSIEDMASDGRIVIQTLGKEGANIYQDKKLREKIAVVVPDRIIDPTGCGDAFRGGLLYGIENNWDLTTSVKLASLMGSLKIAHKAPQGYVHSKENIEQRFQKAFNITITLN